MRFYISKYMTLFDGENPFEGLHDIKEDKGEYFIEVDMDKDTLSRIDMIVTKMNNYGHQYRFMIEKSEYKGGVRWELILLG